MPRYLLSVHTVEGEVREPMTDEEMRQSMKRIGVLEQEMKSAGAWFSSARLHGPETASVVRVSGGKVLTTDGPFAETKEQLGGFYIIQAEDLDAALTWASKVTEVIKTPWRYVHSRISPMNPGRGNNYGDGSDSLALTRRFPPVGGRARPR
jgi:hypothetical protein